VLGGAKLDKFDLATATDGGACRAGDPVARPDRAVGRGEAGGRNPSAPFMTSTLQQEASRKFGMGARARR
jgi:DNA topoisomerase I